jgi:hypothetical protein
MIRNILKDKTAVKFIGDNGKKKAELFFGANTVTAQFYNYLTKL